MKPSLTHFFTAEVARMYDTRNEKGAAINGLVHYLLELILKKMPEKAYVLSVGVGTGLEIVALARAFPHWTFVGVDPSAAMLEVCQKRLEEEGIVARCELVCGTTADLPSPPCFDIALSLLVGHFVGQAQKLDFYRDMVSRLKAGGMLVNTEISIDFDAPHFPELLDDWGQLQANLGATPEAVASLQTQLRETLNISTPGAIEDLLHQSGIATPVRFFQALMINGWHGRK